MRQFCFPENLKKKEIQRFSQRPQEDEWLQSALSSGEPIDLEIGCGVGFHPLSRAAQFPLRRIIAIEQTRNKFNKFYDRFDQLSRSEESPFCFSKNLLPVHTNAISWVATHLPPQSVNEIFLLYPNPNPKRANQRWLRMPFFGFLIERLRPGGVIHVATNELAYFNEVLKEAQSVWGLGIQKERILTEAHVKWARSHFERKYLARGENCYDVVLSRE